MLSKLLVAWCLMAICVAIHATGIAWVMRWLRRLPSTAPSIPQWTWLFIRLAGWIILLHLIEIALWASFYVWNLAMPDLQSALYFSAVTYTTTGYGDLVLPIEWRLHGGVEALTGILMCGWSTGFFLRRLQPDVTGRSQDSGKDLTAACGARLPIAPSCLRVGALRVGGRELAGKDGFRVLCSQRWRQVLDRGGQLRVRLFEFALGLERAACEEMGAADVGGERLGVR